MSEKKLPSFSKAIIVIFGSVIVALSIAFLGEQAFSAGFGLLLLIAALVAPRMSMVIPRSNVVISFSDSVVFLSFLFFGPAAAVTMAAVETLANCYFYKRSGKIKFAANMIAVNTFSAAISTAAACSVWTFVSGFTNFSTYSADTRSLISTLGILALVQFAAASVFAAALLPRQDGSSAWAIWKRDYLTGSVSHFVGGATAGMVYKIISYGDFFTAAIALAVFGIVYLTYRQSIQQINSSVEQAEEAERQKSEVERERRIEAERHTLQLRESLEQEERANKALRKSERDFQHAALHDSLTGLANRKQLNDILRTLITEYKLDPMRSFQVLFLDIRGFKNINDSLGHSIGDKVLMIAAKRFTRMLNVGDTVSRIGGDEFAIVLRNLPTSGKAQKVARRIYESIIQPFSLSGNRINIDVNIGIAPCDTEYNTPEEILRDADIAMHYAKERDDGPQVFTKELRARFLERIRFEMDLRSAIDRNELAVHYQPIVNLTDGRIVGFEALLRWHHAEFGMIPPVKFIPIAEQAGLIQPITVWVLRETSEQLAQWQKISPEYKNLMVSVNISGKHLSNDDLVEDVENVLASSKIAAKTLKLEITESVAMENAEHTINVLNKLKQIGVQLSIDDFGTGYSSLSYLHRLPFDTLKIDRSFVYSVGEHGENSEILQTIISLAKNLKMRVIAEGVETTSQLAVLRNLGCDYAQGFLLAKPQPREETENLLYKRHNWLPEEVSGQFERPDESVSDENLPVF
ncbi:MAG: bifunctional diguanylate cyclase/phosphodiesterase [Pyrinomonadaceae bacterium]